jgi:hypothetical protein
MTGAPGHLVTEEGLRVRGHDEYRRWLAVAGACFSPLSPAIDRSRAAAGRPGRSRVCIGKTGSQPRSGSNRRSLPCPPLKSDRPLVPVPRRCPPRHSSWAAVRWMPLPGRRRARSAAPALSPGGTVARAWRWRGLDARRSPVRPRLAPWISRGCRTPRGSCGHLAAPRVPSMPAGSRGSSPGCSERLAPSHPTDWCPQSGPSSWRASRWRPMSKTGSMEIVRPALTDRGCSGHRSRSLKPGDTGPFRYPHRALLPGADGRAFGARRRVPAGAMLVDCSGSMSLQSGPISSARSPRRPR